MTRAAGLPPLITLMIISSYYMTVKGFPGGSESKESACNAGGAGDPGSIPGLGRSPGGGLGNHLQYSWASLVAQMVKNLPAMQELQETQVRSLSQEDPLEEGMATHSSMLAWRIPMDGELGGLQSMGWQRIRHD